MQAVAETNARLAARTLLERSPVMSGLVDAGSLKVVAAMHDIGTGRVTLLGQRRRGLPEPVRLARSRTGIG